MAADVAGRLEVGLLIDGSGQDWRQVAHLEVLGVAEEGDARRRRRRDPGILMALEADRFRGQQVVRRLGAGGGRGLAGGAVEFQREVQLMRKRRAEGRTPRHTPRDQQDGEPFHPLYLKCQMRLLPSSETSRLPPGSCRMPTGRPQTSRCSGPSIQRVRTSRIGPDGFPSWNGMKAMDCPTRMERFQEPWKARKAPPWYSLGNCLPV